MDDRTMLEMAAKAARMRVIGLADELVVFPGIHAGGLVYRNQRGGDSLWNPLTDDGDRYRLAQNLGLSIDYEDCCVWTRKHGSLIQEFWGGDCPDEAHVIVGVAAAIGEAMP